MRLARRDHAQWKFLRGLADSERERREAGCTLLDGVHLLKAHAATGRTPRNVVVSDSGQKDPEIDDVLRGIDADLLIEVPDAMFEQLSTVKSPTGIIAVVAIPEAKATVRGSCVVLDGVQDAGNVGSIMRSAAAAGLEHVIVGPGSARAWSPRVLRAGMGAHFGLDVHDGVDLKTALAGYAGAILTTEAGAKNSIYTADLRGDVAWLFGNEGHGVSSAARALATDSISIPIAQNTESLNVAAAAAVCIFEQRRQRSQVSSSP